VSSNDKPASSPKTNRRRNRLYEKVEDQEQAMKGTEVTAPTEAASEPNEVKAEEKMKETPKPASSRARKTTAAKTRKKTSTTSKATAVSKTTADAENADETAQKPEPEKAVCPEPEVVTPVAAKVEPVIPEIEPAEKPAAKKGLSPEQLKFAKMLDQIEGAGDRIKAQRMRDANQTVVNHALTAGGFGLVPIPIVDVVGTASVQFALVRRLAAIYGHSYNQHRVKAIIAALVGTVASYGFGKRLAASFFKGLPWGAWTVSLPMAASNGALTYALGKIFQSHFAITGDLTTFSVAKAKKKLPEYMREGALLLAERKQAKA
jgi:uncharacterized protein (DUF697 family)